MKSPMARRASKISTIERIFQEVFGRKMTREERVWLHPRCKRKPIRKFLGTRFTKSGAKS
jgi:hypothetical protein